MRKAALLSLFAGILLANPAFAWHRHWAAGVYIGPVHAGFYSVYAPPPPVYYAPPVAYYLPPPLYYVAPPPPAYVAPPVYYAPPVPPAPPVVVAPVATYVEPDRIPRFALKWSPLGTTSVSAQPPNVGGSNFPLNAGNVGLEYRFPNRYWALRSDFEYGPHLGVFDFLSLKLSLFPNSFLRPYVSGGITGSNVYDHNLSNGNVTKTPAAGGVAAGGLDLFIGKHFFIEAEVKGRFFAFPVGQGSADTSTSPTASAQAPIAQGFQPVTQWTAVLGAGVAYF